MAILGTSKFTAVNNINLLFSYCGNMDTHLNQEDSNVDYDLQSKWMGGLCNCGADATTCKIYYN